MHFYSTQFCTPLEYNLEYNWNIIHKYNSFIESVKVPLYSDCRLQDESFGTRNWWLELVVAGGF